MRYKNEVWVSVELVNNTSDIDQVCLVLWKVVEMPSLLTM